MNILVAVPWFTAGGAGGVGMSIRHISAELLRRGHTIQILHHGDTHKVKHVRVDEGISVSSMKLRSPRSVSHPFRALLAFCLYFVPILLELRRFIRRHEIEVVVVFYPGICDIYYRWLKLFCGLKYVVSTRGSDINIEAKEHWLVTKAVRSLIANASGLVPCSARMLTATREFCHGVPERTEVIYAGIDPKWAESKASGVIDHKRDFVLTLAWATPVKGPDIVMRAFAAITERYPEVDLLMVGSGPQENELRRLVDDLGLTDRIVRLGNIDHDALPPLFKKALFGVVPSRNEGFPKVALEYGLMKKALVATRVGGIPEIVFDGETGLLVASEDVEAMADKMAHLIDHPEECRRMGEAGHRRVIENFTLHRTGDQFEAFLSDVVSG